jgi:DNA recombination-dependent growth factor C
MQQPSTVTYTCYVVREAPGPDLQVAVLEGLVRGRIFKIDIAVGHDRAAGFATWEDPLDVEFTAEKVFFGPVALFTLRLDRIVIPASTLKLYTRQRIRQNLESTRREKMPRAEREELSEAVRADMMRKAIPTISSYPVTWDLESGRVRLHSTSAAVCDEFVTRCRDNLGLELRPLNTVGVMESGLDERELDAAFHLLPASFLAIGDAPEED